MNILYSIILGLIQGLSEFIPISSTAHLTIAGNLMGLIDPNNPEKWTAFIAVIQLGTLVSVMLYFRSELIKLPKSFLKENLGKNRISFKDQSSDSKMAWFIIAGTLPIVTIGLVLKKLIEGDFTKNLYVIGASLIGLAIILFIAEKTAKFKRGMDNLSLKDAIVVGLAQCVALIPGSSRSGTTITAGLFLGLNRESAARFSFLLSIPAVLASGLLQFYQALEYLDSALAIDMVVATIVSAISGYWAIAFLINFLKNRSTSVFIVYRIIIGIAVIWMTYSGLLKFVAD